MFFFCYTDPKLIFKEAIVKLVENEENELLALLLKSGLLCNNFDSENLPEVDYDLLLLALSNDNPKLVNIILNRGMDLSLYEKGKFTPLIARQAVLESAKKLN